MSDHKIFHYSSPTAYVLLYPVDFDTMIRANATFNIMTTWGAVVKGRVDPLTDNDGTITGYKISLYRNPEKVEISVGIYDAISVFTGKGLRASLIKSPVYQHNKIPYACSMNRDKRTRSMGDLQILYKEQYAIHDELLLQNLLPNPDGFKPRRYDIGSFHIVVPTDLYGNGAFNDGFWFFEGTPSNENMLDILDKLPEKEVDGRRIEWIKDIIKNEKVIMASMPKPSKDDKGEKAEND